MEKLVEALAHIRQRGEKTGEVAIAISGDWTAPNFMSPNNLAAIVTDLTGKAIMLVEKEADTAAAAGVWDGILGPWHAQSVIVSKIARGAFKGTDKAAVWRSIRAGGGGRDRITEQGIAIEKAWKASGMTWVPKPGLTYAAFGAHQPLAATKAGLHSDAENAEAIQRGIVNDLANTIYGLCVQWYEMATGAYGPDTPNGSLIRTIPTSYDPNQAPGRLRFYEHFSPAAGKAVLKWDGPRLERANVYALAPGETEFVKILSEVTFTEWLGENLEPGTWKFEGEALNAHGMGELSLQATIAVQAVAAA